VGVHVCVLNGNKSYGLLQLFMLYVPKAWDRSWGMVSAVLHAHKVDLALVVLTTTLHVCCLSLQWTFASLWT